MTERLEDRALLSSTPAMVLDINPNTASSNPSGAVSIGSTTYFSADDGIHGVELWKTNGTPAGTSLVKDIAPGPSGYGSHPSQLTNVNGTLFFTTDNGLWKSDGTEAGTVRVSSIEGVNLTNVNGTLFFAGNDGNGRELWKSDGTTAGTVMVKDIFPGHNSGYYGWGYYANSSYPIHLTNVGGKLFFVAIDGTNGGQLWKSDGTPDGTVKVKDVNVSNGYLGSGSLTNVNGTLFFPANDGIHGVELWKSDGTAAGTVLVKDMEASFYGSYPDSATNVNGTLFFRAHGATTGYELWKSDGTAAGTVLVKDIYPGANGALNMFVTAPPVGSTLYFGADDGVHGFELWKTDGTSAGTVLVKDINPGSSGTIFGNAATLNGTLYFSADVGTGAKLWQSNGTADSTVVVANLPTILLTTGNGLLYFSADDGIHGTELWTLSTAPAPSLGVSGFPAAITAGSAGSFTVTARNADGTTNTGYLGTVHFTSTDPRAVLPADYTFTAADHGVHTFTASLKTAGTQTITATDPHAPGMIAESISQVKAAAASTMAFGGFPTTTTAGVMGNVTVTLKDVYGNIASGYIGTVHFTSSDPQAVLPANYTFTASDAGKHTFSVTLKTAGTRTITVADTLNSALTALQGGITVNAGVASQFLISAPSSVKSGATFSLTLTVKDAYGNVVIGYTGTVRFTSTDKADKLPANYTFKATDQGVHTFTGLILRKNGSQKVTITDTMNSSLSTNWIVNVVQTGGSSKGNK